MPLTSRLVFVTASQNGHGIDSTRNWTTAFLKTEEVGHPLRFAKRPHGVRRHPGVWPRKAVRAQRSSWWSTDVQLGRAQSVQPAHVFRTTVATRLDEAGLSAQQIADHLGHTRPSLTQHVYLGHGATSPEAAAALDRRP